MKETKVCTKCGNELPATTEYFFKRKSGKYGLNSNCKKCSRKYNSEYYKQWSKDNKEKVSGYGKKYYENNKEKLEKYKKKYYEKNKESILEECRKYYEENKEQRIQYQKQYYLENKEKASKCKKKIYSRNKDQILARQKQYRENNKEQIAETTKKWRKENLDKVKLVLQKYKAKKKKLQCTLTFVQWEQIKNHFDNECAYCGMKEEEHLEKWNEQLHQEHFIALSKGGEYTHNNIIPACKSCNSSKNNKDFFEWYSEQNFYSKNREKKILKYLNYTKDRKQQLTIAI